MMPAAGAESPVNSEAGFDAALDVALDGGAEESPSLDADAEDADAAASADEYTLVAIELPSACVVTRPSPSSRGINEAEFEDGASVAADAEGESVDSAAAEAGRIDVAVPASTSETIAAGVSGTSVVNDDAQEATAAGNVDAKPGVKIADDLASARLSESTPWEPSDKSAAGAPREAADSASDQSIEDEAESDEPIVLRPASHSAPARRTGQASSEQVSEPSQTPNAFAELQTAGRTESAPIAAIATPKAAKAPLATASAVPDAVPDAVRANADSAARATSEPAGVEAEVQETNAAADAGGEGEFGSSHGKGEAFARSQAGSEPSGAARASGQPVMMLVQSADGTLRLAHAGSVAQTVPAGGPTPEDRAENITRLVQTMRVMSKDGISEATIRLRPDHLGEVSIAIRVDGRNVTATVQAESRNVREWLQSQEDSLRSNLSQQGLSLDKLQVQRDPKHDRREQQHEQQPRPRYRRPQDVEARFEVSA
jgi:flagellar hook-length control protein FliK